MALEFVLRGQSGSLADVVAGGTSTTASHNAQVVQLRPDDPSIIGTTLVGVSGATAVGTNLCTASGNGWVDCAGYRAIAIQINAGTGAGGAIVFEASNDGASATPLALFDTSSANVTGAVSTYNVSGNVDRFFAGNISFRYFRARVSTTITGGTVQAFTNLIQSATGVPAVASKITDGSNTASVKSSSTGPSTGDSALVVTLSPNVYNPTQYTVACSASSSPTVVKWGSGSVFDITVVNHATAARKVCIYDSTGATMGTTVPFMTFVMAASSTNYISFGNFGKRFNSGLSWGCAAQTTFAGNTAPTANDIVISMSYV